MSVLRSALMNTGGLSWRGVPETLLSKIIDSLSRLLTIDQALPRVQLKEIVMQETTGVARLPWQVRRYRRFNLRYPVHLLVRVGDQTAAIEAFTRDVCIGGLLLESPVRIPLQSMVNFVISMQMPTLRSVELFGEGKVLRVEAIKDNAEFAVALECAKPITEIEPYLPSDAN